jgi:exodeoxyribonuclease V alpha subunit
MNTKTITVSSVDYIRKQLILNSDNDENYTLSVDRSESIMAFYCSLFKVSKKKASVPPFTNTKITLEHGDDLTVTNITSVQPIDAQSYVLKIVENHYVYDIVTNKRKSARAYQNVVDHIFTLGDLNAIASAGDCPKKFKTDQMTTRGIYDGFKELVKKLLYIHRFPRYMYELAKIRDFMGMQMSNRYINALGKYFSGYDNKQTLRYDVVPISYCEFMDNPYKMRKLVDGVTFDTLDMVANFTKINYDLRLLYNIANAINCVMEDCGHMYANIDDISKRLLSAKAEDIRATTRDRILKDLQDVKNEEFVFLSPEKIYIKSVFQAQEDLVGSINKLIGRKCVPVCEISVARRIIADFEKTKGLELHEHQILAIESYANGNPFILISGGPGTGKSSIIEVINSIAAEQKRFVAKCAPTGKASKRMLDGTTIHMLIYNQEYAKHEYLPFDLIIVDESSMLDFQLMCSLFDRIDVERTTVIMAGDENQLPPIDYGRVFKDTLGAVGPVSVILTKIFRQESDSGIIQLAKAINEGEDISADMVNNNQVHLLNGSSRIEVHAILKTVCKLVKTAYKVNVDDIQLLCCCNEIGLYNNKQLNEIIHQAIYKAPLDEFRNPVATEKIIITKNNYVKDKKTKAVDVMQSSFNGDIGEFLSVNPDFTRLIHRSQPCGDVSVPSENIDLGHSISVHRSQGSEYDTVVVFLDDSAGALLIRELLYTAITRAKRQLYIIGTMQQISACMKNPAKPRNSDILGMIRK